VKQFPRGKKRYLVDNYLPVHIVTLTLVHGYTSIPNHVVFAVRWFRGMEPFDASKSSMTSAAAAVRATERTLDRLDARSRLIRRERHRVLLSWQNFPLQK
jgi:hypothetical protein